MHRSFFDTFSPDSPMRHLLRIHIGDVVAGPDRGAGAVEDMIGIEGINGETAQKEASVGSHDVLVQPFPKLKYGERESSRLE